MDTELQELLDRAKADEHLNKKNKITIIAWGGELDRIWPTLILSTTAAASGMEVACFFTFWGLFALVKPERRITGKDWMTKMMSAMNPGTPAKAKLSRYHFISYQTALNGATVLTLLGDQYEANPANVSFYGEKWVREPKQ